MEGVVSRRWRGVDCVGRAQRRCFCDDALAPRKDAELGDGDGLCVDLHCNVRVHSASIQLFFAYFPRASPTTGIRWQKIMC